MKRRLTTILAVCLGSGLAIGSAAHANDSYSRAGFSADNYHSAVSNRFHREPLRLSVRVKLNGNGSLPLRRLISREHNIDTRNYDLRSVSVRSKQRRDACADLQVGHRSSGAVYLREGTTRIHAPSARGQVPWTLHVADARVRRISVELVPKQNRVLSDRRDPSYNSGYNSGYAFNDRSRVTVRRIGRNSRAFGFANDR